VVAASVTGVACVTLAAAVVGEPFDAGEVEDKSSVVELGVIVVLV